MAARCHSSLGFFRRWRVVIFFLIGVVLIDCVIVHYRDSWEQCSPDEYAERVRKCGQNRRDVVFVGGSTVAEGIDPSLVAGFRWHDEAMQSGFAVGLAGGTSSDVYFATIHACPSPPKLLVYGITASDINDSRHEPHGPHSLMKWADVCDWRATRPDAAEWVTRHYLRGRLDRVWSAFHYRHGIRMWAAAELERACPGACPTTAAEAGRQTRMADGLRKGDGYVPTEWFANRDYATMKSGGWVAPPFEYLARYQTGSHVRYLHRLVDWANERGVELVLVDMPRTADLEMRHPAEFAEYRARLQEVASARGVRLVLAARERTGLDDRHFADLIHLNREGAAKFSDWLHDELEDVGRAEETPRVAMKSGMEDRR